MMRSIVLSLAWGICAAAAVVASAADEPRKAEASSTPSAAERPAVEFFRTEGSRAPFSPAVRVGDVLYLSGHIGFRRDGTLPEGIVEQTRAAMDNISAALALAGSSLDAVFKCTVMLADISQWAQFNKVYVTYFKPDRLPARSAFQAAGLVGGAALELECMAYAPPPSR